MLNKGADSSEGLQDPRTDTSDFEARRLRASLRAKLFGGRETVQTSLGRFVVLELVGAGGMGTVYAAYDPDLDRKVALKLLASTTSETAHARLLREAQAMARVTHPNVVTVHEVGTFEGQVFIAMEFVRGMTFREWCDRNAPGCAQHFHCMVDLAVQAILGLVAAHEAGLVHRDVKPSNMLVGEDGRLRMADFGLARTEGPSPHPTQTTEQALPSDADATLDATTDVDNRERSRDTDSEARSSRLSDPMTRTGEVVGTPAYMAPEQFEGRVDPRSDQFSLCATLWEATYGERPFPETALAARLASMRSSPCPPAGADEPPAWWLQVLRRGLAFEPDDRYPSMAALLDAVETHRRPRRRHGVGWFFLAAACVLGAVWVLRPEASVSPCHLPDDVLEPAWGVERRAKLDATLAAADKPETAREYGILMHDVIDRFTDRWQEEVKSTCKDLVVSGELVEGTPVLDQPDARMQCHRETRAQMDVLIDTMLVEAESSPGRAVDLVYALPNPGRCDDRDALAQLDTDERRSRGLALARAAALANARRLDLAEAEVRPALEASEQEGDHLLVGRARTITSMILLQRGEFEHSLTEAHAALGAAERSGHAALMLEAWLRVFYATLRLARLEEASFYVERARSHAEVFGTAQRHRIAHAEGALAQAQGRYVEAASKLRETVELNEALHGSNHPAVANALGDLSKVLDLAGDPRAAVEIARRALAINREAYGEHDVRTGETLLALALQVSEQGDRRAAAELFGEAKAVLSSSREVTPARRYFPWVKYAESIAGLGRVDEAQRELRAIEAAAESANEQLFVDLARQMRAGILLDHGQTREAAELYEALLPGQGGVGGPINLTAIQINLAVAWARLGRHEEAHTLAEGAEAALRELVEPGSGRLVASLGFIGEVHRHTGRLDTARRTYEECLAGYANSDGDNVEAARARLGYALTLHALGEIERALAEAERTRDFIERDGTPAERDALSGLLSRR
jgi:eukaryotic-like serine/threonine-protein kinase